MQQEELQQIQKWCQQSEDAILFYAPDGTLLWQNDAAAETAEQLFAPLS